LSSLLRDHWRTSTFRLAVLFGILFAFGNVALLGSIYWQISVYLEHHVDSSIMTMSSNFRDGDSAKALEEVNDALAYDLRKTNIIGLFAADGTVIAGNMKSLPRTLPIDGEVHLHSYPEFMQYTESRSVPPKYAGVARIAARRLSNGELLVVGRDFTELLEIKAIVLRTLLVSGAVILVLGWAIGFALSIRPLRRINAIRETSRRIVRGELSLRIPASERHDELDMLAIIVNLMLDEIERLLTEVKGVTDNLAHDLRTPLTRLRLLLQRAQLQTAPDHPLQRMLDQALTETDSLLGRFRALLRISEIENLQRKAGFSKVDLRDVLLQIADLFEPLAEEKAVKLALQYVATDSVLADPELLFEGLSNLVDNAIKFTPSGGNVAIKLSQPEGVPRIDVIDSGCGIEIEERDQVLQRYYRGNSWHANDGHGLGLSIVAAIMQLHGFSLKFQDSDLGTHITVFCGDIASNSGI
jgi:signal transduction histidine kinase